MRAYALGAIALVVSAAALVGCSSDDESSSTATGGAATGGAGNEGGGTVSTGGAGNQGGAVTAGGAGTEGGSSTVAGAGNEGGSVTGGGAGNAGGAVTGGGAGNEGGAVTGGGAGTAGGAETAGGAGGAGPDTGNTCASDDDCVEGAVCFDNVCVMDGDIRITLSWDALADLDLVVQEPDGTQIDFGNPSGTNGYLDVDDCPYYDQIDAYDCIDAGGTHVENVFFDSPADGTYLFAVRGYYTGASSPSVNFTVTVTVNGTVLGTETGSVATDEQSDVFEFDYP